MRLQDVLPFRHRVLIKPFVRTECRSSGGLVVPETVAEYVPPQQGEVLAVGAGVSCVSVGEKVVYGIGIGHEFRIDSEDMLIIHEGDVICELE